MNYSPFLLWSLGIKILASNAHIGVFAADSYVLRPLDETIEHLGLQQFFADIPELELAKTPLNQRCEKACHILSTVLPSEVQFPGSDAYASNKRSYWAEQQAALSPRCFVAVTQPLSVSISVAVFRKTHCPFSVRSGGHSDVPGASNIENGVTIDLRFIRDIVVSDDKRTTSVGAGAIWGEVYMKLDPMDLTVLGGRLSSIGIGGLTLGGGLSFFSGKEGFACDNVQVIMSDARLENVNQTSHPDLYRALRGGGNNFGIVTRFDLDTYPQGEMWSTVRSYRLDAKELLMEGLVIFNEHAADDPDLSVITSFVYVEGQWACGLICQYAHPVPDPELLRFSFESLTNTTPIQETTRISRLANLTGGLTTNNPPSGYRDQYTTKTYKNSIELQKRIVEIVILETDRIRGKLSNLDGFVSAVNFQGITSPMISKFSKRGGNILGIDPHEGPLLLVLFNFAWASAADDHLIIPASESILSQSNTIAAELGLLNDFIYMNYAGPNQSPFASYGRENLQELRRVQAKYDPYLVFEDLQPGGFKLNAEV
ncbi:hypothetical protein EMCG_06229 [[Emmonsia] crescens]|uniref:FAD-binding PCMH-type domain-containing protein n=1 Tax=[Emmonsia] crescens TaxID=73230 RepID=A0A0G2J716_9EURO|nr:hypothetical protein EMCG_06229 [Emmonsia crescens UAMH 3008]